MFLYKLFDAIDQPLYVGITKNPENRFQAHRSQPWWTEVARRDVSEIPDDEAFATERKAIRQLAPKHNKLSHPDHPGANARTRAAAWISRPSTVTSGKANTRYGLSVTDFRRTRLAHFPAKIFLAWRGGAVVAIAARWKCGGIVRQARLSNETSGLPECPRCLAVAARDAAELAAS